MAVRKKDLTPLRKGGTIINSKNKGAVSALMPDRQQISGLAKNPLSNINDYAKATPMAHPLPPGGPFTEGM